MENDIKFHYSVFTDKLSRAYDKISDLRNDELRKRLHELAALDICYYVGNLLYHVENLKNTGYYVDVKNKYNELLLRVSEIKREYPNLMNNAAMIELDKLITKLDKTFNVFYYTSKYDDFRPEDEEFDYLLSLRDRVEFVIRGIKIVNTGLELDFSSISKRMEDIDEKIREKLTYIAKYYVKKEDKKYYLPYPKDFWWYSLMFNEA